MAKDPNRKIRNANLIHFTKGTSGNPKGRPKRFISLVLDQLDEMGVEQVNRKKVTKIYRAMIALTESQLNDILNTQHIPYIYKILAKEILSKRGFDIIERMIDRANGKPTMIQDINHEANVNTISVEFNNINQVKLPTSEAEIIEDEDS